MEIFRLWRNPVFLRFCRSRLRLRKSIFWYLLTLIVTSFVVSLIYIIGTNSGTPAQDVARGLWIAVLVIQGLILMIKGTGSVSAGFIQDKIDQTLDYQRLTPVTPARNLVGYLFGLPVLEYVMLLLTLPHLVFIVVVGQIPLTTVFSVYLVFFTCVILYHVIGIAAGMVMRRWIWGYLLSIFLVVFVNIILPAFISQLGLKFVQYLSVWPVIGQKVLPLLGILPLAASQNPFLSMAAAVPFYTWNLSAFTFTLLLQSALIATFATMALRKWRSSRRHALSRLYGLGFLTCFVVLLLGNLWPAITRQYMPFAIFGETNFEELNQALAVGLPLVYCLVIWLLCFVLFSIVIPDHHSYVRGLRRAIKLQRNAARPWEDDSGSVLFMGLFTVVALVGFWVLFNEIAQSGFLGFLVDSGLGTWRLPVALGLVVVCTGLLLQVFELKATILVVLLLWLLPILVAIVLSAAIEDFGNPHAVIASLSPLALVLMSGLIPMFAPGSGGATFDAVLVGIYSGLTFVLIQIVYLLVRWHKLTGSYYRQCRSTPSMQP